MSRKQSLAKTEQWKQILQRWQRSGLTQAAFCRQEHLNPNTFTWWKMAILGKRATQKVPAAISEPVSTNGREKFIPVTVDREPLERVAASPAIQPNGNAVAVELTTKDGSVLLKIFDSAPAIMVEAVIAACFKQGYR